MWTAAHVETQRSLHLPHTVLCAVDGMPKSAALLQWADQFCHAVNAQLRVLHVVGPITDWPSLAASAPIHSGSFSGHRVPC